MYKEITAIIIDDEDGNREFLAGLLKIYCPWVQLVGEANSATSGLTIVQSLQPNILFLDVRMPKGSGFELLDRLELNNETQVIFVTAHDQYAVRAFRYSAQDYLLKPILPKQLIESVVRAGETKDKKDQLARIQHINSIIGQKEDVLSSIVIRSTTGQVKIKISEIVRCQADGNYTLIFVNDLKRPIVATKSLKEFDELFLTFDFLRIHQSHLVNMKMFSKYVRNKDSGGGRMYLINGDQVDVSRSKKKILLARIYD